MALTYSLGFEPLWILIDQNATPAGGGYITSWRSLNKSQPKLIFQNASNTIPYPNSGQSSEPNSYTIAFDANGVAPGPFYFETDTSNLNETYFIQAFNAEHTLLWQIDGYLPGGSGSGGNTTTFLPLTNYIANNQFINALTNATPVVTTTMTNLVIAPSNHEGFTPAPSTALALNGTFGVLGPDVRFLKNSTANTDSIAFPTFTLGSSALTGDVTPVRYLQYVCGTGNPGETYKCFQFPICQKVQNLSNQLMTFRIWANATTPVILDLYTRQYFGSGTGATVESSPATRQLVGSTPALTGIWTAYDISFTMPNISGKSIGSPNAQTNDDAVYLQLSPPLNTACTILFTKPQLYLGDISPDAEFEDYDQINSINSTPRCGDVRIGLTPSAPLGWLAMDDSTIGNSLSVATTKGDYLFQLYSTIYTSVSNAWAPVSGGRSGGGTTMANAITDFLANKTLTLPRALGRALAGANPGALSGLPARVLGEYVATSETHAITLNELAPHTHNPLAPTTNFSGGRAGGPHSLPNGSTGTEVPTTGAITGAGAQTELSLMQPTSFMNVYIKI